VAPVLPAANEEGLHPHHTALGREREHIGIAQPRRVDRLRPLDKSRRTQSVAQHRRSFELQVLGCLSHLPFQISLHRARFTRQEVLRLPHQRVVISFIDPPHTGRRTPLDLIEQAGPVTVVEETVGATPQQEQLLQRVERRVDAARAGKRAVVIALCPPRTAMFLNARKGVIGAQKNEGEALVIAQQHVERRAEPLDQLRFQQQRLSLGIGGDDLHGAGLADHALKPAR